MVPFPSIDPVAVPIVPLAIRWYGLTYLLGFLSSYLLVRFQLSPPARRGANRETDLPVNFLGVSIEHFTGDGKNATVL